MKSNKVIQLISVLLIFILLLGSQGTSTTAQESIDKNQTLYVGGSGPNNYTSIQTAINEAQAQDIIYIYDGVYKEPMLIEKEITLLGESTENVVIQSPENYSQNASFFNVTFTIRANNVKINRITLDFMGVYIYDTNNELLRNIQIENIYFPSKNAVLNASRCSDVLIYNCTTPETIDLCVFLFNECTNVSLISNKFHSKNDTFMMAVINTTNVTIIGNDLQTSTNNSIGILGASSSNIHIIGNTMNTYTGLFSVANKKLEVKNNNFINCARPILHSSPFSKAKFDANYYGQPRILPKLIRTQPFGFRIDWHPRSQPYDLPLIAMQTNHGSMILELYSEEMPITSQNFMDLTKINFFDGIVFHRVVDDFVIQGGGFDEEGDYYESPFGEIPFESHSDIVHIDGAISMARTNDPDSATSQFFICDGRQKYLDDEYQMQNNDQHGYAAFGALVSGFEVLRDIASVETARKHMMDDWPVEEVIITYARLAE